MVASDSVTPIPADGTSTGPVTGGTVVTLTGADLDTVATVTFGTNAGTVVEATETTITIQTPPSTDFDPGVVPVELLNAAGTPIVVTESPSPSASPSPTATPAPAASAVSQALTFSYVPDPRITAQINYVNAHWNDYNTEEYGSIRGNDCVNFASQSLIERGWTMDAEWNFSTEGAMYSTAWASSTAFAAYLTAHPERATPLTDEQRDQVKVGDVVQFDWDRSGDRDHTGIVTSVTKTDAGVTIQYAGHTFDTIDKSVDESLANSGGTVSYFSVK
nr:amidase domain-containing protein [Cryobacterium roopkundense]